MGLFYTPTEMSTQELATAKENALELELVILMLKKVDFKDNEIAQNEQLDILKRLQKLHSMEDTRYKKGL